MPQAEAKKAPFRVAAVQMVSEPEVAANLKRAHALLETGTAVGKIVLAGWG